MTRALVLLWAATLCAACETVSGPSDASDASDPRPDRADFADLGTTDAGSDDAETTDGEAPALGDRVRLTLEDERSTGELVHVYDQRIWWASAPVETWLLFVPEAFAPYPDDRSFRFVDSDQISKAEVLPWTGTRHDEVLRQNGVVFRQSPLGGIAQIITGHEGYHLEEDGRGDFAWDLVVTSSLTQMRFSNDGASNEDYFVFDRPIYLPTAGEVVEVVRDGPDNVPGFYPEHAINNFAGVHVGGQYYVYILHFRPDSIPIEIQPGVWLEQGSYLGRAGNSGVSLEPHVHITMLYFDVITGRTWSVPSEFLDLYVSKTTTGAQREAHLVPVSGDFISSSPF